MSIGWVIIATGISGVLALVFISLFFGLGGDNLFGTLNDIANALLAILSGISAWKLHSHFRVQITTLQPVLLPVAWIGVLVAVLGSMLVIFRFTGWVLAGLYTTTGFAFIGLWMIGQNWALGKGQLLPQGLHLLGLVAGGFMLFGFAAVPGIIRRIGTLEASPGILNALWQTAGLGWLVLYPAWCVWLGLVTLKRFSNQ
jgi:hypothetical protein